MNDVVVDASRYVLVVRAEVALGLFFSPPVESKQAKRLSVLFGGRKGGDPRGLQTAWPWPLLGNLPN